MIKVFLLGERMNPLKFPAANDWEFTEEGTVIITARGKPAFAEIPRQRILFIERIGEEGITETAELLDVPNPDGSP